MKVKDFFFVIILFIFFTTAHLQAAEFSTSVRTPTPLGPEGSIGGSFPRSEGRTAYYFFADLRKGELLTQIFFNGQLGKEKRVEFALLDENASLLSAFWIQGIETQRDAIRSFPVERTGRQLLRVTVSGPETDRFRLEFGGSALLAQPSPTAAAPPASTASTNGK